MSDDDIWREFTGGHPARPKHPDMDKLSEVLLRMDSRVNSRQSDEENQRQWERTIAECGIDKDAVSWASIQRAMRMTGVETQLQMAAKAPQVTALSSAWLDGFIAGALYHAKTTQPDWWPEEDKPSE